MKSDDLSCKLRIMKSDDISIKLRVMKSDNKVANYE